MKYVTAVLLAFDVPHRFSQQRDQKKRAAIESGTTSVRIAKSTLNKLHALSRSLGELSTHWGYRPPITEVLEWLASAQVIQPDPELYAACTAAISKAHAKSDGKSMQSPRPPRMHAPPIAGDLDEVHAPAGKRMQSRLEAKTHAKRSVR